MNDYISSALNPREIEQCTRLAKKICSLGGNGKFLPKVSRGPLLTVYYFQPSGSTRISEIQGMADDFAVELGVQDVSVKRAPGESAIAIFVPNPTRNPISFRDSVSVTMLMINSQRVPVNFGVDYTGRPYVEDLASMPHLLIAGATGSGKSTLMLCILSSLVYCLDKDRLRLFLSDTKGVEFSCFDQVPHLMLPIAKTPYSTLDMLDEVIRNIDERMKLFAKGKYRNLDEFNEGETEKLPRIMVVIDELADLLQNEEKPNDEGKTIKKLAIGKLGKIVQRSRAAGVHVIGGLQRPSVDIMNGSVKSNFPARCTFRLPSQADSRTVIGGSGAEHLLAQGDMLYVSPNRPGLMRLHSPLASRYDMDSAIHVAMMHEECKDKLK